MINKVICRTAPATPDLLIIYYIYFFLPRIFFNQNGEFSKEGRLDVNRGHLAVVAFRNFSEDVAVR